MADKPAIGEKFTIYRPLGSIIGLTMARRLEMVDILIAEARKAGVRVDGIEVEMVPHPKKHGHATVRASGTIVGLGQ